MTNITRHLRQIEKKTPPFLRNVHRPNLTQGHIDPRFRPPKRQITTGLIPYSGPWTDAERLHLLKRCLFGVSIEDLRHFQSMTMEQMIDALLQTNPNPPPPINDYNDDDFKDPEIPYGQTWINSNYGFILNLPQNIQAEIFVRRFYSFKFWWIRQIIASPRTIHEKLTFFWHNHFAVQLSNILVGILGYQYYMTLRNHALGHFPTLVRAITLDPAMLIYLNGAENVKDQPDENYARELQELFTIGKGPDSGYTEHDVRQAARILTGWTLNLDNRGKIISTFVPYNHDTGDKQFSAFYNHQRIAGQWDGTRELDALIEMLTSHPTSARFLCRELYRFFVFPIITKETEKLVIQPLAELYRREGYQIRPVLRTLLSSEHFFDPLNRGAMVKNPLEHLMSLWRGANMAFPTDSTIAERAVWSQLLYYGGIITGLEIGDPPSVAGWPAYYLAPQYDLTWITTSTVKNRTFVTDYLMFVGFEDSKGNTAIYADWLAFTQSLTDADDPNALIHQASQLFLGQPLTDDQHQSLKKILLSGQKNDNYWTAAWLHYLQNPDDPTARQIVLNRLIPFFRTLLHMAEAYLC